MPKIQITTMKYEPTCPLCHGSLVLFDFIEKLPQLREERICIPVSPWGCCRVSVMRRTDMPVGKDLEDYPRYLCTRCKKFISIEPADELCKVIGP
jgi:hypothetical protein